MKTYGAHEVKLKIFLTSTQQRGQLRASSSDKLHLIHIGCDCDTMERGDIGHFSVINILKVNQPRYRPVVAQTVAGN